MKRTAEQITKLIEAKETERRIINLQIEALKSEYKNLLEKEINIGFCTFKDENLRPRIIPPQETG